MAALNISTYKAEQEKPWLAGMMQKGAQGCRDRPSA